MGQKYFKRGINLPIVTVENPLPKLTLGDMMKMAKVDDLFYGEFPNAYFGFDWKYSGGLEMEVVSFAPGEARQLPQDVADMAVKDLGEQGLISYPSNASEAEKREARMKGIQQAQRYWDRIGKVRVIAYQRNQNFSDDQLDQYRSEIWKYYVNQAAADLLMKILQEGKNASSKARPVSDEVGSQDATA